MNLPKRFPDRDDAASVLAEAERLEPGSEGSEERRLAGRGMARRGMGQRVFLDLAARSGRIQLFIQTQKAGPVDVDLGDTVGAVGVPLKTRRGEPSLGVTSLELLAKMRVPLPDTYHGKPDTATRVRKRYLDRRTNEESRADAILRSRMV